MTGQPTIGIVVPDLRSGGGVAEVVRFLSGLIAGSDEFDLKLVSLAMSAADDCNSGIFSPKTWFRGPTVRETQWEGLAVTHVGAVLGEFEFQRYKSRKILAGALNDCDLIQVVSGGASWALAVTKAGKPVVLAVATRTILERRRMETVERGWLALWRRVMTRITDRLDDRALQHVDAVVVMNPRMHRHATGVAETGKALVRYGPPGVDTELFRPRLAGAESTDRDPYILSVGRFSDPRKNVGLLLEAFAEVQKRTVDPPYLSLVGRRDPGPDFWNHVHLLDLTDAVVFHENVDRATLVDLYQNALCFALASDEEGFGFVVTEAMACGIPVVVTRSGGPDGIVTDGYDGYLVKCGDAQELADRLHLLVEQRSVRAEMGARARRKILGQFSQEVAGDVYLDTYRQLLAGRC